MRHQLQKPSPYVYPGCQAVLENIKTTDAPKPNRFEHYAQLTTDEIITSVCTAYEIEQDTLRSTERIRSIMVPRQIIYYLCEKLIPEMKLDNIGRLFGLKFHHSTILHHKKVVMGLCKVDKDFAKLVTGIELQLHSLRINKAKQFFIAA